MGGSVIRVLRWISRYWESRWIWVRCTLGGGRAQRSVMGLQVEKGRKSIGAGFCVAVEVGKK